MRTDLCLRRELSCLRRVSKYGREHNTRAGGRCEVHLKAYLPRGPLKCRYSGTSLRGSRADRRAVPLCINSSKHTGRERQKIVTAALPFLRASLASSRCLKSTQGACVSQSAFFINQSICLSIYLALSVYLGSDVYFEDSPSLVTNSAAT